MIHSAEVINYSAHLNQLQNQVDKHEAVCSERYKQILERFPNIDEKLISILTQQKINAETISSLMQTKSFGKGIWMGIIIISTLVSFLIGILRFNGAL